MLSKLFTELKSTITLKPTPPSQSAPSSSPSAPRPGPAKPVQTNYTSLPVPIPPTFLKTPPDDARPATARYIDWSATPIPEYAPLCAVVLDHVLSLQECATLLELAEASVPCRCRGAQGKDEQAEELGPSAREREEEHDDPWAPALVNVGGGYEVLEMGYRNGDRIVWDCQAVVDRIWERCGRWEFLRVNERMRFLRYGKGGFFRPHCDGPYSDTSDDSRIIRTLFTMHVYLNDSKAEVPNAELVGGATTFFSSNEKRRIDVNPKAGRVLIFQHRRLLHSGDDVLAGTKYTMRTDIMYEYKKEESEEGKGGT
ncbi:hypothetical protein N658DRAFT_513445 [Parathielavia hyrcaniae]|uniref:Prolyl 4-hydroxylase alpha subunit domain-containing protein n=1 Tax=Parathielavia hyrcaniae TaxID=113614 RepID=A0AAN6T485_9PEZI|nr:hypothetical protein N658DRAFT_513445 [Parathielavia hyrcaniae]